MATSSAKAVSSNPSNMADDLNAQSGHVFRHVPLLEPRTIRILTLLPGLTEETLVCKIGIRKLDREDLDYEALSYAWGDPRVVASIQINNARYPIAENLHSALLHLRHKDHHRTLWIDAVCINQKDDVEKGQQIQLMRDIYGSASQVIVWLGSSQNDSDMAIELLSRNTALSDAKPPILGTPDIEARAGSVGSTPAAMSSTTYDSEEASLKRERALRALMELAKRPYWSRVWVLQEIALSKRDPIIQCGHCTVLWSSLEQAVNGTFEAPFSLVTHTHNFLWFQTSALIRARDRRKRQSEITLGDLLSSTLTLEATDEKDKVFALLGLAPKRTQEALKPDYSLDVSELFTRTARHVIEESGSLNILCISTNTPRVTEPPIPTWVPDWTLDTVLLQYQSARLYAASSHAPVGLVPANNDKHLRVAGIFVDEVVVVSNTIDPLTLDGNKVHVQKYLTVLAKIIEMDVCKRLASKNTMGNAANLKIALRLDPDPRNSDQFWRTVNCDQEIDRTGSLVSPAGEEGGRVFDLLMYPADETQPRKIFKDAEFGFDIAWPRLSSKTPRGPPAGFRPDLTQGDRLEAYLRPMINNLTVKLQGRQFFITRRGRMGLFTTRKDLLMQGDKVVVLLGSNMPFILRNHNEFDDMRQQQGVPPRCQQGLHFLGEAYVHGLMRGEAIDSLEAMAEEEQKGKIVYITIH